MSQPLAIERRSSEPTNQNDKPTKAVAYIRDMLQELNRISPPEAGQLLPYLIAVAQEEASQTIEKWQSNGVQ